ncbi:MAG: hypothetical protein HY688_02540 [Chloroflexi bacterium]|nr:hypothetical protein [Chloroflexota bacterium]
MVKGAALAPSPRRRRLLSISVEAVLIVGSATGEIPWKPVIVGIVCPRRFDVTQTQSAVLPVIVWYDYI